MNKNIFKIIFSIYILISIELIPYDNRSECTPACNNRHAACLKSIDKKNLKQAQIDKQKCEEEFKECSNHCNQIGPSFNKNN